MNLSNEEIINFLEIAKDDLLIMSDECIKLGGENSFSAGYYAGLIEAHKEFIRLLRHGYDGED